MSICGGGASHDVKCSMVNGRVQERKGYDGPIEIMMADKQIRHLQGVTGGKIIAPAGSQQYKYAIQLAPWMQPGRTARMVVCGSAIITDFDGTKGINFAILSTWP